ncbi:MAG TPA: FtsX-like permease family protein, partial [Micromonosporaceae bacterium]
MLRIALSALGSRRTQTATLMLLAMLVTAAAVAAPFFVYASTEKLTVRDIAAAPSNERGVTITKDISVRTDGASTLSAQLAEMPHALTLPGFATATGVRVIGSVVSQGEPAVTPMSERDDVCAHVTVVGSCPTALGQTMISSATAGLLEAKLGSQVKFSGSGLTKPITLTVVGIYQPRDASDPYWGQATLAAQFSSQVGSGVHTLDAMFVSTPTILASRAGDVEVDRTLILVPQRLSVRTGLDLDSRIAAAATSLHPDGYTVTYQFTPMINRIVVGTNQIFTAIAFGAVEVLLFGWFALFLSIRSTAMARRFDIGILKLRGVQRRKLWALMTDQSLIPLLAGAPFGAAIGFFGARTLSGSVVAHDDIVLACIVALAGLVVTLAGGLLAA